ncbi:Squalene epoxidase [Neonectria punicea]|uniref:Squalene epoxidase n=1 Tax=Neonectria punicea TaxID=979145 RepID=A0ABR1H765_9HYPO
MALFVCVWTVLHHNIQAPHDGYWAVVARKLRWAALAIWAPEVLTLFSIMQWNAANISVREMRGLGYTKWTKVHAFYANAGGFVLATPGFPPFPINATSVYYLVRTNRIAMPDITRNQIWDRSKADRFAKGLAFLQAGWLLLQIVARASQSLSITPLEVFTAAFIVPTLATTYFWSSKPQNVAEPNVIRVDWTIADLLLSAGDAAKEPYVDTPMDFIDKPVWDGWCRFPSLLHFGGLETRPLQRIPNDYSPPPPTGKEATIVWVVSVVHAVIHLVSWSFPFPTQTEEVVWRTCSLILLVVMVVGGLVPVLSTRPWFDFTFNLIWIWTRKAKRDTFIRRWIFRATADCAYAVYIIARVLIFLEIFLAFRAMPEDVYY